MAARLNKRQTEKCKEAISATLLMKRLANHVHAPPDEPVLSSSQIRAAEILLRKFVPDLAAVQHTGADGGPLDIVVRLKPHGDADS